MLFFPGSTLATDTPAPLGTTDPTKNLARRKRGSNNEDDNANGSGEKQSGKSEGKSGKKASKSSKKDQDKSAKTGDGKAAKTGEGKKSEKQTAEKQTAEKQTPEKTSKKGEGKSEKKASKKVAKDASLPLPSFSAFGGSLSPAIVQNIDVVSGLLPIFVATTAAPVDDGRWIWVGSGQPTRTSPALLSALGGTSTTTPGPGPVAFL